MIARKQHALTFHFIKNIKCLDIVWKLQTAQICVYRDSKTEWWRNLIVERPGSRIMLRCIAYRSAIGLGSCIELIKVIWYLNVAVPRNYDATLHPLQAPREYVRALNAVKLERVFAKPFLGSLDGHRDGISTICKHPQQLPIILSGACDGEVSLVWSTIQLVDPPFYTVFY